MPVISLSDRLEEYVGDYLCEVVPDDIEVVYSTSVFQKAAECEHGDLIFENVLWLTVWVNHPEPEAPSFSVSGVIPVLLILDGDMGPVDMLLEEVWGKAAFGSILGEMENDLEAVARSEEGGSCGG